MLIQPLRGVNMPAATDIVGLDSMLACATAVPQL